MYIEENSPNIAGILSCYQSEIWVMRDFGQNRQFHENVLWIIVRIANVMLGTVLNSLCWKRHCWGKTWQSSASSMIKVKCSFFQYRNEIYYPLEWNKTKLNQTKNNNKNPNQTKKRQNQIQNKRRCAFTQSCYRITCCY